MKLMFLLILTSIIFISNAFCISESALVLVKTGLRDVPDFEAEMCCSLAQWDTVEIIEEKEEWFKVKKEDSEGWASKFSFSILSYSTENTKEDTLLPVQTNMKDAADYNCGNLLKDEYDRVTGTTLTHLNELLKIANEHNEKGFLIDLFLMQLGEHNVISFKIGVIGAGHCIDDNEKAYILFRDGTRLELTNMDDFNCKGTFGVYLSKDTTVKELKKQIDFLSTKQIEILRVHTSNGYVEEELTDHQSNLLMNAINCLSNY